jgi:hypothetical protein
LTGVTSSYDWPFCRDLSGRGCECLVGALHNARGFKVITTHDAGLLGQSDNHQLEFAANQHKLFLTHNRIDFEGLHRQYLRAGKAHWGIVIASRRSPHAIAGNLLRLLNNMTADELRNQLLYI